jgi:hypothetical protein
MEDIFGGMENTLKENGKIIKLMEKGKWFGDQEIFMKENGRRICAMDTEHI